MVLDGVKLVGVPPGLQDVFAKSDLSQRDNVSLSASVNLKQEWFLTVIWDHFHI